MSAPVLRRPRPPAGDPEAGTTLVEVLVAVMILGVAVYGIALGAGWPNPEAWIFFPLVVRAFGLLATIGAGGLSAEPIDSM